MAHKNKLKNYSFYNIVGFFIAGIVWSFALDTNLFFTTATITFLEIIYAVVMRWTILALKMKNKDNARLSGLVLGKVMFILFFVAGIIWIIRIIF